MRVFPAEVERKLFELDLGKAWRRSGLIDEAQYAAIEKESATGWARGGGMVRLLFFGFSCLAQAACVALAFWDVNDASDRGIFLLCFGAACYVLAEWIVRRFRVYRFGVEEGLVVGAVLSVASGIFFILALAQGRSSPSAFLFLSLPAAAASYWVHLRFGYLYSCFGIIAALTLSVAALDMGENPTRVGLALFYAGGLAFMLSPLRKESEEWERFGQEILTGSLLLGIYVVLNLRLEKIFLSRFEAGSGLFHWATFALIWVLPAGGLIWGVKTRRRAWIIVSSVCALLTIMTWKPYLGLPRRAWDPAVLGLALMALASWVSRWLARGQDGLRAGYTALQVIVPKEDSGAVFQALGAAAVAAAAVPEASPVERHRFGGGSSGGGGASRDF